MEPSRSLLPETARPHRPWAVFRRWRTLPASLGLLPPPDRSPPRGRDRSLPTPGGPRGQPTVRRGEEHDTIGAAAQASKVLFQQHDRRRGSPVRRQPLHGAGAVSPGAQGDEADSPQARAGPPTLPQQPARPEPDPGTHRLLPGKTRREIRADRPLPQLGLRGLLGRATRPDQPGGLDLACVERQEPTQGEPDQLALRLRRSEPHQPSPESRPDHWPHAVDLPRQPDQGATTVPRTVLAHMEEAHHRSDCRRHQRRTALHDPGRQDPGRQPL